MVDFNNETTIGTPAIDIERVSLLEYRYAVIESIGAYDGQIARNIASSTHVIRKELFKLFLQLQGSLKRKYKEYDLLYNLCRSNKYDDLLKGFIIISQYLDGLGITKIDTRPNYDTTNPEISNRAKGL